MRLLLCSLLTIIHFITQAQNSYSEDSLRLAQNLEWLEAKLTYNYYNVDDEEWWINRFTYNEASKSITIKNIASPQLQAVSDKTYLQLNFQLEDLNPYTISVEKNDTNAGRLVVGKTIRLGAYHHDKAIKKTRNGQISSQISFVYLSIPKHYEDSVSSYTENIAARLTEAIILSTRLQGQADARKNTLVLNELLQDQFTSATQSWTISALYPSVLEITIHDQDHAFLEKRFLRFQPSGELEWTILSPDAPTKSFLLKPDPKNTLHYSDETHQFTFFTINEFSYTENGQSMTLIRDWTFDELK